MYAGVSSYYVRGERARGEGHRGREERGERVTPEVQADLERFLDQ
jgi:hypothetical protein